MAKLISQLDSATQPVLGTDLTVVSRDGQNLTKVELSKLPVSDAVATAIDAKVTGGYDANGKLTSLKNKDGSDSKVGSVVKPLNNKLALFGDSRTQYSTGDGQNSGTSLQSMQGYLPWLLARCGYRVECVDNYAVAGQDLVYNLKQLDTVVSPGTVNKGNIIYQYGTTTATNPAVTTAGSVLILAGVNGVNGTTSGGLSGQTAWDSGTVRTKTYYDLIITRLLASGKTVLLSNELPNQNGNGAGAQQIIRRQKLDEYPVLSDNFVKINTWDVLSATPAANTFNPLYIQSPDNVHPNRVGNKALGEYYGDVINQYYSMFPMRNQLPAGLNSAGYLWSSDMVGTVSGTNITGSVFPTGTTATRTANAGITVTASTNVNAEGFTEIVLRVTGTGTNAAGSRDTLSIERLLNAQNFDTVGGGVFNNIPTNSLDKIYSVARISCDAGNVNLLSAGCYTLVSGSNPTTTIQADGAFVGIEQAFYGQLDNTPFDYAFMSPPNTLPVEWSTTQTSRTIRGTVKFSWFGDRAVDLTIRISQFGIVRNR